MSVTQLIAALLMLLSAPPRQEPELVWRPYLQQVSDTSAVICWTTREAGVATVLVEGSEQPASSAPLEELHMVQHCATLTGLQPATDYSYTVQLEGEQFQLRTAPQPGSDGRFSFLAIGDYGTDSEEQEDLRDLLLEEPAAFLVTTGDNAYPVGSFEDFEDAVFEEYGDLFDHLPIFPSMGNHDYLTENGRPYMELFNLPRQALREADQERYYAFDYGNTRFIVLDSQLLPLIDDDAATNDMLDWLRIELSTSQRRWTVVVMHHPAYSTGHHGSEPIVREVLVPLFERYEVDLVLTGHDHIYQRTHPLRGGSITSVEDGGIVYVVTGGGSRADYTCDEAAWLERSYCAKDYGIYSRITIDDRQILIEAIDDQAQLRDSFAIPYHEPHQTNWLALGAAAAAAGVGLLGLAFFLRRRTAQRREAR